MWSNLYKNLLILFNGFSFSNKLIDEIYQKHLGHKKIIGFERGKPVYSMFFPAFLSDQYRNLLIEIIFGVLLKNRGPSVVSFAVTDRCNSHCEHCIFRSKKEDKIPMNKEEISKCINEFHELGICSVTMVGGEPLMHPDIISIIQMFDKSKINLVLFTNGSLLCPMSSDLRKSGLNRVMVSIDFPEAHKHDAFRKHKGLFEKAINGIRQAQKQGMFVGMSTTINPKTTVHDLSGLFELAKKLKVCEIFIIKEYDPIRQIWYQDFLEDEYYQLIKKVNSNRKYKFGVFYYPYFSQVSFGCMAGSFRFYISPYGDVTPCDSSKICFGNIKTDKLRAVWTKMSQSPDLGCVTKEGCRAKRGLI